TLAFGYRRLRYIAATATTILQFILQHLTSVGSRQTDPAPAVRWADVRHRPKTAAGDMSAASFPAGVGPEALSRNARVPRRPTAAESKSSKRHRPQNFSWSIRWLCLSRTFTSLSHLALRQPAVHQSSRRQSQERSILSSSHVQDGS